MENQLIELRDGIFVEVEVPKDKTREISGQFAGKVETALEDIKPILKNVCKPVSDVFQELNQDAAIESAEVEITFGFEAEGNIYITRAKANSNLTVKLKIKPKQ
ncbi:CU044_2847 family protein [Leptothoe sp. ISB3NOV94-8A]